MGNTLDKPKTEKDTTVGCSENAEDGLSWGVSSMQGWRLSMEDAHICASPNDDPKVNVEIATTDDDGLPTNPPDDDSREETTKNHRTDASKDPDTDGMKLPIKGDKDSSCDGSEDDNLRLPPHHYFFC